MKPEDPHQVGHSHDDAGLSWWWTGDGGHEYGADKPMGSDVVEIRHSFFCQGCKSLRDHPESITMGYQAFLTLIGY